MDDPPAMLAAQSRLISRRRKKAERNGREIALKLTRNATVQEIICMAEVGKLGLRFEFQRPVVFQSAPHSRVIDLFLPDYFIAIEIDGKNHFTADGKRRDGRRVAQFENEYPHFKFIRFSNRQVDSHAFPQILQDSLDMARRAI